MNDSQKSIIKICVWITIILFMIRFLFEWKIKATELSIYDIYGYIGESLTIALLFTGFYEKIIWRINPFEKTPRLSRKYTGTIKSSYNSLQRNVTLEIKQSLLSIHVTLISDESKSMSLSASIDEIMDIPQLTYCYLNTPKSEFRDKSAIHYGTAILCLSNPKELTGQYYTDRKTIGDMHLFAKK